MMNRCHRPICLVLIVLFSLTTFAEPVAENDRTTIDLRRTTLVVADIDTSLAFYRDALRMKVIYDRAINTPRGATNEEAEIARRLVMLRANDDYIGIIGLLQYIKPKKPRVDLEATAFHEGTMVLVFNTETLDESFAEASQISGVVVIDEPKLVEYPSYDGQGSISVMVSTLQDPDGFTVELNQLQEELH
ncbi:MAG: VOC family protein [Gammaproteobacteria bacterium]|nr:VOC family protein [Gammaproteobacteria bacterium]